VLNRGVPGNAKHERRRMIPLLIVIALLTLLFGQVLENCWERDRWHSLCIGLNQDSDTTADKIIDYVHWLESELGQIAHGSIRDDGSDRPCSSPDCQSGRANGGQRSPR
jgi:hypothetical protein